MKLSIVATTIALALTWTISLKAEEATAKKGLSFVPFPMLAYDGAKGFLVGGMLNVYDFGNGESWPKPVSSYYADISIYTGGSMTVTGAYDSGIRMDKCRIMATASYCADKSMSFYGYDGYNSFYDSALDESFYRYGRNRLNVRADLRVKITDKLSWEAGYHFNALKISDYAHTEETTGTTLFQLYKTWGIIPETARSNSKFSSAIRAGIVLDTRDFENVPSRGILAHASVTAGARFMGSSDNFVKVNASFRQYVPLVQDKLTFAYRVEWHGFAGKAPWYLYPCFSPGESNYDNIGLGGYRMVRGIMYNRVQSPSVGWFNTEFRWKFASVTIWKQHIGLMASCFCDGIRAFRENGLQNKTGLSPEIYSRFVNADASEHFHVSAGGAIRFILNHNFVLTVEYGKCTDPRDGIGALMINSGFYF